ncbi:hypothetical protein GOBAR_AA13766 [Gossypium barbadense]|uniref:Uncharacterized protein n=1 Tax=Gossypium barbadense TaxID=3634 RepID=A0A2P5XU61_GOSBA|nr:hypothetical protein GOBAR_AA13766 [Gossypium barbadense]
MGSSFYNLKKMGIRLKLDYQIKNCLRGCGPHAYPSIASFNPSGYEKYSGSAAEATKFGQDAATTGIPVSSSNAYYTDTSQNTNTRPQTKTRVRWSSGLCDCFSDWRNCCITCWCPCVTFGQIAEIVDKGSSCNVWGKWSTLHTDSMRDGLRMLLFLLLPSQNEAAIHVEETPLRGLPRPLLLRVLRLVPRVP